MAAILVGRVLMGVALPKRVGVAARLLGVVISCVGVALPEWTGEEWGGVEFSFPPLSITLPAETLPTEADKHLPLKVQGGVNSPVHVLAARVDKNSGSLHHHPNLEACQKRPPLYSGSTQKETSLVLRAS